MRYRVQTGMFAWILFRITGLALVFYLSMHILVISRLQNATDFNATMDFLGDWRFRLLEIGLLFAIVYHAMNGIRIFLVDFFKGSVSQAKLWWIMMAIAVVLCAAGTYPMLMHALHFKSSQAAFSSSLLTPASALNPEAKTNDYSKPVGIPNVAKTGGCASCAKGVSHSEPVPYSSGTTKAPTIAGGGKKGGCCGS